MIIMIYQMLNEAEEIFMELSAFYICMSMEWVNC